MPGINICNQAGRDAVVNLENVRPRPVVRWLDQQGRQASSVRVLKATVDNGLPALEKRHGRLGEVAEALIAGDPEIDIECTGRILRETSRVYVDQQNDLAHRVSFFEVIKNPDGSTRERRPRQLADPNVTSDHPLRWTGIMIPKQEACRRFVFVNKVQLQHINGLTYDFLFAMAKQLEEANSVMVLGAGPKSNQPLILRRGGTPYRGFLEGRTRGDQYRLVLHFSNLELKALPQEPEEVEA